MRFEKLILENFSSFYGKHQIEFHTTSDKPITIVVGGSGYGKTSIFDALNYALYGKQYEAVLFQENEKKILDYINETALKEALITKSSVEMACTLFFEHEGKHYRIQQAICVKNSDHGLEITDISSTLYELAMSGNSTGIPHIDSFLNEILPSNVRDYFLFNGDRINKLAMPGASEEIRDGIYRVVDLELLQNGANHLLEVAKKFRRSTKDSTDGVAAEIESKYSEAYDQLDEYKRKLFDFNEEKRSLEANIEIVTDKLRGMDVINALQSKRDILKINYNTYESSLKQIIAELRSLASTASLGFGISELNMLKDVLSEKREKGEIPSSISESLLKDILEIGKCICGSEFRKGDNLYNQLNNRLLREKAKGKRGQDLLDLYFDLNTALVEIDKSKQQLDKLEDKRVKLESSLIETEKELAETLKNLINAPEEEISKLASNLSEYSNDLSDIRIKIQNNQKKIKEKEDEIKDLQSQRAEQGARQARIRKYQLRDTLAQNAADELQRIFEKFAEDSRQEVQELTRKEFIEFIPTASVLTIGIDNEFHYDVRDQNGNTALQQLSNGQKQALSLAYITSISRVSEKNPPLVIDMPFGRLDEDVQDNIANRLPELASQVVLLVLPGSEWNEITKSILRGKSSDIYTLEFDDRNRQTSIRKE